MGDAGEGLVDAESRIAERMEELERERTERSQRVVRDPDAVRDLEALKLARRELDRQLHSPAYDRRRKFITEAIAELDKRMAEVEARIA
jgi:hypothetical protein